MPRHVMLFPAHNIRLCCCNFYFPLISYINTVIWFFQQCRITQVKMGWLWITDIHQTRWPSKIEKKKWKKIPAGSYQQMFCTSWHPHKSNVSRWKTFDAWLMLMRSKTPYTNQWCLVCDHSSVKYRTQGKEEKNNIHKRRLWGRILQSFVESTSLSFGPDPRWGLLGLPSFLSNSGLSVSEGREGPNVRTRAPTVRKPCQDLHNEHEGSTPRDAGPN